MRRSFSKDKPAPAEYVARTIPSLHGYSVFSAPNATHLRMQFLGNHNGSVVDEVWLQK